MVPSKMHHAAAHLSWCELQHVTLSEIIRLSFPLSPLLVHLLLNLFGPYRRVSFLPPGVALGLFLPWWQISSSFVMIDVITCV